MQKTSPRKNILAKHEQTIRLMQSNLLTWYHFYGRHFPWRNKSCNNYEKIIAEILLQRTRAETIACFYSEFLSEYPYWRKLARANIDDLERFLRPVGLWRRRAKSILELSREMTKRNGRFPINRQEIERMPGIGQYLANAILLLCHGEPEPLLDSNMARVLERVFGPRKLADIRYDPYLQELARNVVTCIDSVNMNFALIDFSALVCTLRNPNHAQCPLSSYCKFLKN